MGVKREVSTVALVCPDPNWMQGTSIIVGTNSSLFQILTGYYKQKLGNDIQRPLRCMPYVLWHIKRLRTSH